MKWLMKKLNSKNWLMMKARQRMPVMKLTISFHLLNQHIRSQTLMRKLLFQQQLRNWPLKQMQAPLQATMLAIGLLVSHHFFNNQIRRRQLNKLTRALSINRNRLLRWQLCLLHQDFQSFLEVKRVVHKHHNIPQSPLC